jgi:MmyB-like transcription regulator ligand binding domain
MMPAMSLYEMSSSPSTGTASTPLRGRSSRSGVNGCVALLRTEAGRNPYDKDLSDLVGELSTRSDEFRIRWASHNVKLHRTGLKRIRHPIVGAVTVDMETFELPGDPGQTLVMYTPEPDSPSQEALALLASWAATPQPIAADDVHDT